MTKLKNRVETVAVTVEIGPIHQSTGYLLEHGDSCVDGMAGLSFVAVNPATATLTEYARYQLKPICSRGCAVRFVGTMIPRRK